MSGWAVDGKRKTDGKVGTLFGVCYAITFPFSVFRFPFSVLNTVYTPRTCSVRHANLYFLCFFIFHNTSHAFMGSLAFLILYNLFDFNNI